jgi:hypothetical protein
MFDRVKYAKEYYLKHRTEILAHAKQHRTDPLFIAKERENHRKWELLNKEKYKVIQKRFSDKLRKFWGYSSPKIAVQAEVIATDRILPALGFDNIIHLPSRNCRMLYDILAEKEGIKYGISVTTSYMYRLRDSQRAIANFFGLKHVVLFVKPSLNHYRLLNVNKNHYAWLRNDSLLITKNDF